MRGKNLHSISAKPKITLIFANYGWATQSCSDNKEDGWEKYHKYDSQIFLAASLAGLPVGVRGISDTLIYCLG